MEKLRTLGLLEAKLGSHPVLISRTGFTGDLGYEVWVERESALDVYDTLLDTGADRGLLPVGGLALRMLRIEAGLLLLDVDFESSRFAFTDDQRATAVELGYGCSSTWRKTTGRSSVAGPSKPRSHTAGLAGASRG